MYDTLSDKIILFIWKNTHRIKKTKKIHGRQMIKTQYVPQWWLGWWHYYWHDIGYQAVSPEMFDTFSAAYDFATPYWMPDKETKLEYYKKKDQILKKLDEANNDF